MTDSLKILSTQMPATLPRGSCVANEFICRRAPLRRAHRSRFSSDVPPPDMAYAFDSAVKNSPRLARRAQPARLADLPSALIWCRRLSDMAFPEQAISARVPGRSSVELPVRGRAYAADMAVITPDLPADLTRRYDASALMGRLSVFFSACISASIARDVRGYDSPAQQLR